MAYQDWVAVAVREVDLGVEAGGAEAEVGMEAGEGWGVG